MRDLLDRLRNRNETRAAKTTAFVFASAAGISILLMSPQSGVAAPADVPEVSWKRIANGGTQPDLAAHSMVFDQANEVFWIFGGIEDDVGSNDFSNALYRLDASDSGALWQRVNMGGLKPAPVAFHTATYDPLRKRMVVYGGQHSNGGRQTVADANTVWFLDLTNGDKPSWSKSSVHGNSVRRFGHAATYAPEFDAIVFTGGSDNEQDSHSGGYALLLGEEPMRWVRLANAGFSRRTAHAMAYDAAADRLLVYGGIDAFDSARSSAELISLDISAGLDGDDRWRRVTTSTPGLPRGFMATAYDPETRLWWVHGGLQANNRFLRDLSVLDLSTDKPTWTRTQVIRDGPLERFAHVAAMDAERNRIVFQGGTPDNNNIFEDTRALLIESDVAPTPTGATPTSTPTTASTATATSSPPSSTPGTTQTVSPSLTPGATSTSPTPEPSASPSVKQLFIPLIMRGAVS